ncbi:MULTISPECIES: AAA family ATPase [Methylobacterium]|uniref:ATP-dependent Zn proteases n=2 Tax=Methylobacterium TaxID=407 RepID=A0A1Y0ZBT7_9HYPH|nr:AAA family ATPase [Methylobacterium aquaticum]QRE77193.1 AAA family ATPase [Methylobacterium aquaticum]BAR47160.1 ATP-dependent Zn proteases [Methylobacterium aquaticum]
MKKPPRAAFAPTRDLYACTASVINDSVAQDGAAWVRHARVTGPEFDFAVDTTTDRVVDEFLAGVERTFGDCLAAGETPKAKALLGMRLIEHIHLGEQVLVDKDGFDRPCLPEILGRLAFYALALGMCEARQYAHDYAIELARMSPPGDALHQVAHGLGLMTDVHPCFVPASFSKVGLCLAMSHALGLGLVHLAGDKPAPEAARPTERVRIFGDDGLPVDDDGDAPPAAEGTSPVELTAARQLARTLDAVPGLREALAERDVVVVIDVPEALPLLALDGMTDAALGLPTGLRRHVAKEAPKGTDRDRRWREFLALLRHPGAILCLSPDASSHLPAAALLAAEHRLTLAPVDASDVAAAIRVTTGAACSREDRRALDGLRVTAEHLAVCIRPGRAPADCVAHLVRLAAPPAPTGRGRDITLDELHGCREAVAYGREVIRDLQAWRDGAPWSSVSDGALVSGPPGTGKTLFAQALAASAGIPLVAASLGQWQSADQAHLGTTLRAMRATFAEAKALAAGRRGCLLLTDECDVFVDRRTVRHEHADYVLQVTNAFLECLDGVAGREGVVVIGTTNDADRVDPAIRRPGRLGRHIEIGLPEAGERVAMLRVRLGDDLPGADLLPVAYRTERYTGAMIEALVEDARRRARHAGRPLALDDLLAVAGAADEATPAAILDRIAVHEAGHALMAYLEEPGREMVLALQTRGDDRGWMAAKDPHQGVLTRAAAEDRVRIMLGGRAAEEILLDSASSGARQDLLTATHLVVSLVGEWGMGGRGLVAVEQDPAMALAADPLLRRDVQDLLDRLYGETLATVSRHAGAVRRIADALVERRRLDGDEVARLVAEPAAALVR